MVFGGSLLISMFFFLFPVSAFGSGSCIQCHEAINRPSLKELHAEWNDSTHSRMGVTCENCHGGDPGKEDKEEAHQGVYKSMDPKSTVYYTNIPRRCGRCHKQEFLEFMTSGHYKMLMAKGVGPNCVTCHDAMSTKVLQPAQLELFCGMCHNARMNRFPGILDQAKEVLLKMNRVSMEVVQTEAFLQSFREKGRNIRKAEGLLNQAKHELFACRKDWHAFKLDRINQRLNGANALMDDGMASLRVEKDKTK